MLEQARSGVVRNHKEQGKADRPSHKSLKPALLENGFFGMLVNVAHNLSPNVLTIPQPVSYVNG